VIPVPGPSWLRDVPLAHRGLHAPGGPPENPLAAFTAARAAGFGVELDVRLAADGVPVVVHDADLVRVAGRPDRVERTTAAELAAVRLAGADEGVPTLAAVLAALPDVPVMVELKHDAVRLGGLEAAVAPLVVRHRGPVCVASFHPGAVAWFRRHAPGVVRVLTLTHAPERGLPRWVARLLAERAVVRAVAPHALSHDVRGLPASVTAAWRAAGGPVYAWTVRDAAGLATARAHADAPIFEGLGPAGPAGPTGRADAAGPTGRTGP
jgi:glycerophosphoryl diester phosphodiesterase